MRLFFSSINDSLTLLSFRLRAAPLIPKILGFLFVVFSFCTIVASIKVNSLIRTIMNLSLAENPSAETTIKMKEFVGTYLEMYSNGDMDTFVSIAIALLLGSIIFVPFSGYVIHGVVSHSEMVIVKNGDNYKIGDSLLFQVISSFTLIQIIGLTVVSQLLTFDSEYSGYATIFVWGIWVLMTLVTAFFSWVVEYVARRYGRQMRIFFLSFFVLGLATLFVFDPNHGTTLFGSSRIIFDFLNQLATGDLKLLGSALILVAGACVLFIYMLTTVASETLRLPEPIAVSKTNEKQIKNLSTAPLSPFRMLAQLLFRYAAITKPVMTSLTFSLVLVVLLGGVGGLSSVMIVLPLAVSISFGANIFGLVSGSMNWLLTIEGWRSKMLTAGTLLIGIWIVLIYILVLTVGYATRAITVEDITKMLPSFIVTTITTTVLSIWLSVKYPLPFSGKARENLVSSPIRLMIYVGLLLAVTGSAANATFYASGWYAWALCGLLSMIAICCYYLTQRKWNKTDNYTQRILKETINSG
jgi:hypothetical protein